MYIVKVGSLYVSSIDLQHGVSTLTLTTAQADAQRFSRRIDIGIVTSAGGRFVKLTKRQSF